MCVSGYVIHIRQLISLLLSFVSWCLGFGIGPCTSFPDAIMVGFDSVGWLNVELQSLCPKDREKVTHPRVIQHPEKWFQALLSSARQNFASYTSNWLEQMFDFRRYTSLLLKLISSLRDSLQNLSLGTNPICNAVSCFPHYNNDDSHSCDEKRKSPLLIVCHMPESILWLLLQICWPTTECQVFQIVPNTSISRQFVSILLTFSNWFEFFLLELIIIQARTWNFVKLLHFLFANPQYLSTHFRACPSMS